jgi:hypothetical protein
VKQPRWITAPVVVIAAGLLAGCASDEQRARKLLDANAAGILACDQLYEESGAELEATLDAMMKGEWSAAEQQFETKAHPATTAYTECMNRERAGLASKLDEAGIPDGIAARVSET